MRQFAWHRICEGQATARKPIIRTSEHPYHIWARCNNKEWYKIPLTQVFKIYAEVFSKAAEKYNLKTVAFVLMENHFHSFIHTPNANIDECMMYIMRQSSLRIGAAAGRINKIYGGRYRSTVILNESHQATVLKYIFRNPVKAGICKRVEDYPYSTYKHNHGFPIAKDLLSELNIKTPEDFFNAPPPKELEQALSRGLKKQALKNLRDRHTRRVIA